MRAEATILMIFSFAAAFASAPAYACRDDTRDMPVEFTSRSPIATAYFAQPISLADGYIFFSDGRASPSMTMGAFSWPSYSSNDGFMSRRFFSPS